MSKPHISITVKCRLTASADKQGITFSAIEKKNLRLPFIKSSYMFLSSVYYFLHRCIFVLIFLLLIVVFHAPNFPRFSSLFDSEMNSDLHLSRCQPHARQRV